MHACLFAQRKSHSNCIPLPLLPPPTLSESDSVSPSKRTSWQEVEGVAASELLPFPTFTSPERQTALLLCGWSFMAEGQELEDYLKRSVIASRADLY